MKTNSLIYKTDKIVGKKHIFVNIRLDDECKNGHQDFSITGSIYEAGKPKIDRYYISGGCIHDDIQKYFPEFSIFISLHLCDYKGIHMHAASNMLYHLKNGFNSTKVDDPKFKGEYIKYYRITEYQYDMLSKSSYDDLQFTYMFEVLAILDQWQVDANKGIKYLEELTGNKFEITSERLNYTPLTEVQKEDFIQRMAEGYYTEEKIAERLQAKNEEYLDKMIEEVSIKIKNLNEELKIKEQIFNICGKDVLDNTIYYNHNKTIKFNWKDYGYQVSDSQIEEIKNRLVLPEGVKIV